MTPTDSVQCLSLPPLIPSVKRKVRNHTVPLDSQDLLSLGDDQVPGPLQGYDLSASRCNHIRLRVKSEEGIHLSIVGEGGGGRSWNPSTSGLCFSDRRGMRVKWTSSFLNPPSTNTPTLTLKSRSGHPWIEQGLWHQETGESSLIDRGEQESTLGIKGEAVRTWVVVPSEDYWLQTTLKDTRSVTRVDEVSNRGN